VRLIRADAGVPEALRPHQTANGAKAAEIPSRPLLAPLNAQVLEFPHGLRELCMGLYWSRRRRGRHRQIGRPMPCCFQHRVMGGSSSAKADTIGQDVEEECQRTILVASIFRWMRRMFAFSIAKGWWFARARPSRRRRLSPANWRKRQLSSHRVRDRTHGVDPVSRFEPAWSPGGLRREPTGLTGAQVTCHPQDRPQ
jgi:hypothetical protein